MCKQRLVPTVVTLEIVYSFELTDDRQGTRIAAEWVTEFFFDVPLDGDTWQSMALVTLANNTAALYVDGVKYFPSHNKPRL